MNRHERRKTKALSVKPDASFRATIRQVGEMCDVIFYGVDPNDFIGIDPNDEAPNDEAGEHGWVFIYASASGRKAVEAVFPNAYIAWRFYDDSYPLGWWEFVLNLPEVAAATMHHLPLEITRGAELDQATPDALAFLLAMAAKRQGARVAVHMSDGKISIFTPGRAQ
jgi:hypothetical protein